MPESAPDLRFEGTQNCEGELYVETVNHRQTSNTALAGFRLLAMPPPKRVKFFHFHTRLLQAAKARWDWQIDILCEAKDCDWYKELASPGGRLFTRPNMLHLPSAWEANPDEVSALDQRLWEAEMSELLPSGQIVLAGISTIGRGFAAPLRYIPRTAISVRVTNDNAEPAKIVRRLYRYAEELLDASKPDLVLTYEWAKPWRLAVWLAARSRNIPCLSIRPSKILSDHHFWTTDRLMLNLAALERAATKRNRNAPVSDDAKAYINAFRNQPTVLGYIQAKWAQPRDGNWLTWHARFVRGLPGEILRSIRGQKNEERAALLGQLIAYNRRYVALRRQGRYFQRFDVQQLAATKYVYFPMHKETDLPLSLQAPLWQDQRNTVEVLASCLPAGYRLLVREHRANYGHRSTRYLKELCQLPGVDLIDPFDSQFKYLVNADLVVTENGSSGWEGLLLRRRVLTLASNFYDGADLATTTRVQVPAYLGALVVQTLTGSAVRDPARHDRQLGWMFDAEKECTFPMSDEGTEAALDQLASIVAGTL